jgi:uncharacterized protein
MALRPEGSRTAILACVEAPIRLYRRFLSPALPRRCKYEPSCSVYALSALRAYGIARGGLLAVWRLLRCNPFSQGGYDPLEAQTLFRSRPLHRAVASDESVAGEPGEGPLPRAAGDTCGKEHLTGVTA